MMERVKTDLRLEASCYQVYKHLFHHYVAPGIVKH